MDYEKAYKEALERAKVAQETYFNLGNITAKTVIETIFPELRESEDDRIRKLLIEWVKEFKKLNPTNVDHNAECSEAIAWLEKQGNYDYKRVNLNNFDARIREFSDMLEDKPKPYWDGWYEAMEWVRTHGNPFEKHGEQKPTDKGEPKFKVGDWIVKQYLSYPFIIIDIKNDSYILNDIEGNKYEETIDFANRVFHLWTIKDEKDGDVLTTDSVHIENI
jgi:hypothetical protein